MTLNPPQYSLFSMWLLPKIKNLCYLGVLFLSLVSHFLYVGKPHFLLVQVYLLKQKRNVWFSKIHLLTCYHKMFSLNLPTNVCPRFLVSLVELHQYT